MSAISRPEASVSMWPASTNSARLLVHHAPMTSATRMVAVIPNAIASLPPVGALRRVVVARAHAVAPCRAGLSANAVRVGRWVVRPARTPLAITNTSATS